MINQRILSAKVKTTKFMIGINSVWKAMTFISVLSLAAALFLGCGEPNLDDPKARAEVLAKAIDEDSLQSRRSPSGEKLHYAPNQERPYAGWVKSGRKLYQFQNGKTNGIYISWYSNGQNRMKGTFRNGEKDGLWVDWHENGQKEREGTYKVIAVAGLTPIENDGQKAPKVTYKEGVKDGLWTEWYNDGTEMSKGTYKSSIKNGAWAFSYKNGQKSSEGTYTNDTKEGLWTEWYIDGKEMSKGTYKSGIKNGVWVFSYENGQKSSEGSYAANAKDGLWTEWYTDGKEKKKGTYKDDKKDGTWIFFYKDGKNHIEGNYTNDYKNDLWIEWYPNGTKMSEGTYKDDSPFGVWTWWYDNGTKKTEGSFKGGKDWSYVYFDPNSKKDAGQAISTSVTHTYYKFIYSDFHYIYTFPGTWIEGIADGKWIFWHANGQKWAEGNYKDGNGVGHWTWWWPAGNKAAEGRFANVKSDIWVTEFGLKNILNNNWVETWLIVGGAAVGEWTFWHALKPSEQKQISKWFDVGLTNDYKVKGGNMWDWKGNSPYKRQGSMHEYINVRYKSRPE